MPQALQTGYRHGVQVAQAWSQSHIAGTLKLMWPDEPQRTFSHETIHTCIYAMPKGELRKALIACV